MCDELEIQVHRPVKVSEQLIGQYAGAGTREYGEERPGQAIAARERFKNKRGSEVARIMRKGFAETDFQGRQQTPPAVAPVEKNEYANLSSRQKKKLDARREKNLKQARKQYGNEYGCTEDTLPMMAQISEYKRKQEGARPAEPTETPESALRGLSVDGGMFDRPYAGGADTAFDIGGAMAKNKEMKDILGRFDGKEDSLSPATRARVEELRSMQACMENAIRTLLAANGIDYKSGAPDLLLDVRGAKAKKAGVLSDFRKRAEGRREAVTDSLERLSEEAVREKIAARTEKVMEAQKDMGLQGIPFAFAGASSLESMLEIKKGLDANPERYAANRDAIDRMFAEFMDVNRLLSDKAMRAKAFADLGTEAKEKGDDESCGIYNDICGRILSDPAAGEAGVRMAMLGTMIRYLAEGRGEGMEDWMHTALEEEYGIVTEERRLQKEELASFEAEETNRKFKESFPFCDKHSVTIADAIALENKRRENAFSDSEELIKTSHSDTDPRVLRIFCSGYDVGADGEPLTAEDTEKKERDMRFIGDYCSGDVSRRFPQLERITGEIMGISLTPDMLTEEYIIAHAAELKCIGDRMSYFENIMRRNKDYFDSLPQPELDSIKARATLWAAFSSYVANFVNIKGINFQNGELFRAGDRPTVSNAHLWGETLYKRTLDAMERMEIRRSMGYA